MLPFESLFSALSLPSLFSALPLLGILQTVSDLGLVIKIMVFAYLLYWLFIVFREQQMLLGLATIIAAYFMFFHQLSVIVLVLLFFVFIVMSGHFQFIIDMGIVPILGFLGFRESHGAMEEQVKMEEIQKKLMEGVTLSPEETDAFRKSQEKQTRYEERARQVLSSSGYSGHR